MDSYVVPFGRRLAACFLLAAGWLAIPAAAPAQSGVWSQNAGGPFNWGDAFNWQSGTVADGANNSASFNTSFLNGPTTVTLDTSRTIGSLLFDNPSNTFGWTLRSTGGTTLTLNNSSGPSITVNNAALTVAVPAALVGTQGFVKTGVGTLSLTNNNTNLAGGITVSQGILIASGSSTINPLGTGSVTLAGGTLRLGSGGGFNQNMVVGVGSTFANSGITATMDGGTTLGGNTWYQLGQNTNAPTTGVPMGTNVTSQTNPQFTYAMQPVGGRNVLMLDNAGGNSTGRFTLATPTTLNQISFLTSSGNGAGNVTATIHYSDGSADQTGTFTSPDWFNGNPTALVANGRINAGGYNAVNSGNPQLYDGIITNPLAGSPVSSIDLSWTGGTNTHTAIFAMNAAVLNGDPAQTFGNNVTVTADSTIDVRSVAGGTLGNLSIGTNTLSITGVSGVTLSLGNVLLTGNPTFNTGPGMTATLGALNDGGTARTITTSGSGTLTLGSAAGSLGAGTVVNLTGGTLNLNATGALGTQAAVTLSPGATLNTAANQTIASLAGTGGLVKLNTNTLTVNGGTATSFGGTIANGPLVIAGSNSVQTLSGANSMTSTSIQAGAKVISTGPGALGSAAVNLANNATLSVAAVQPVTVSGFGGSGTGWNLQGNGPPTVTNDALTITTANGGIANSAWFGTKVPVGQFTATFRFSQSNPTNPADGITFGFQNQSATAVGGAGGGLGYTGITPSAALTLNIYAGAGNQGPGFSTNGSNPGGYLTPGNISLQNAQPGNEVTLTMNYDGTNITLHMVQGSSTFDVPAGALTANLPAIVGSTAYIGFTGGTGGQNAQQVIDQFSYNLLAQTVYSNAVSVAGGGASTVNVIPTAATPTITMGTLGMGAGSTLNVGVETGSPNNLAYGLTFGATTLNGAATFNVANNGTGTGTLTLNSVGGTGSSLTKAGAGTLVLNGPGTYDGLTTVSAGALLVRNQSSSQSGTGTGAVSVANGATLGGTGQVAPAANANITLNDGGRLFLQANATESLRLVTSGTGSTVLGTSTAPGSAAVIAFKLSDPGTPAPANSGGSTVGSVPLPTNHGFVTMTGAVSLPTGLKFEIDGTGLSFNIGPQYSYQIGQINGFSGNPVDFTNPASFNAIGFNAGSLSAEINASGAVFVNFTAVVPEPSGVLALTGLATLGAGWYRRRRGVDSPAVV
jgi:autotransporter-associated beta strand protein